MREGLDSKTPEIVELITQKTPIDGKGEFYWSRGYSLDPDNVSIYFVNVKKKILVNYYSWLVRSPQDANL